MLALTVLTTVDATVVAGETKENTNRSNRATKVPAHTP